MAGNNDLNYLVCQFGMPLYGVAGVLPFGGNYFWVNSTTGSDGNTGGPQDPFATLTQALAKTTNNNNDVIFLTGTYHTTSTINWSNSWTHLVGLDAPSNSPRARISSTGATPFQPLVNVTGAGCQFINIGTFHGGFTGATGTQVCWLQNAAECYFKKVAFYGGGDATTAALANMSSLVIDASDECVFEDCTIGLDTITRATNANASVQITGGSARTTFLRCRFQALVSDASDVHINIAAGGADRYVLLEQCSLINAVDSTATAMSAAITNAASCSVLLNNCISLGATAIATTGPVYINQISAAGGGTTGIAIKAT
jgi:hypothetical protein